jgi:hypothetical protein
MTSRDADPEEATRATQLELMLTVVQERVRIVLNGYVRGGWPLQRDDIDDIVGAVTVRVLRKLRAGTVLEEERVQNIEAFATTLATNAMRDFMRSRNPERTRTRQRLRYLFTRDPRLALWDAGEVTVCGLAAWRNQGRAPVDAEIVRAAITSAITSADDAIAFLARLGEPVRLQDLVSGLAAPEPLHVVPVMELQAESQSIDTVETRQYLRILWEEIRELSPSQRAALLLNLREPASGNAVLLLVIVGIASLEEIAAAMEMSPEQLSAIWNDLPLDDLRIAEHLGVNRQQVINMRKSARERLTRRMRNRSHR